MEYDRPTAERLMEQIIADPASANASALSNDLLKQFQRGYSLNNLRQLLGSQNQDVAGIGTWIASELGVKGRPLLAEAVHLLAHPSKKVRFFAIDCTLTWASPHDTQELANVVNLLEDPEPAVRWKAMDFLARASRDQLQGALSHLETAKPRSKVRAGLVWLLSPEATNPDAVISALQGKDALALKFAAAGAARMSATDSKPLSFAASVSDSDVNDFASSRIALKSGKT